MKRKILSILLALVLVLSFSLVTAAPVAAAEPTILEVSKWTEDAANPIFDPTAKAYYPTVVKVSDSDYRMWYGSGLGVGYATSPDGLDWTEGTNPVTGLVNANHPLVEYYGDSFTGVNTGDSPSGDTMYYRIWYWDQGQLYSVAAIRYAESADGTAWYNDQAITGNIIGTAEWNRGSYGPIDVLYNSTATNTGGNPFDYSFAMYFDGTTGAFEEIGLGYSPDGISWTLYGKVLPRGNDRDWGNTDDWDSSYTTFGTIIKEADGKWHMWYSGGQKDSNDGIGYAHSSDGLNWVRSPNNPIMHQNDGVAWRDDRSYCPMVIEDGGIDKMWFSGKDAEGNYAIGYATNTNPDAEYTTIQAAIDEATGGDTVIVAAGTYLEHIRIDKPLTLRSTNGAETTIIDGSSFRYMVDICSSDVTFEGFTVTNLTYAGGADATGILIQSTEAMSNVHILDNIVTQVRSETGTPSMYGATGINVGRGPLSNVVISGNTIEDIHNPDGASVDHTCGINVWDGADGVEISNNSISDIKYNGILLQRASNVQIEDNPITECETGIRVEPFDEGAVSDLTVTLNNFGDNLIQVFDGAEALDIQQVLGTNDFDRAVTVDRAVVVDHASLLHTIWSSIQDGIDAAVDDDTVIVAAGTYKEHIVIDKSNLNLIGEDKATTIIDATQDSSWTVAKPGILIGEYLLVDGVHGVKVSGFTIRDAAMQEGDMPYEGAKYGVGPGGLAGIQIYNSSSNIIENNILINNYWQIWLVAEWPAAGYTECKNNRIAYNIIMDSENDGVYLYSDGGVYVENTEIVNNEISNISNAYGESASGVEFWGWPEGGPTPTISSTVISGNNITNCTYGVKIRKDVSDITGTLVNDNEFQNNKVQVLDATEVLDIQDVLPPNNKFDRAVVIERPEAFHVIYSIIQDAINAADPGDTVLVYPGIYIDDENGDGDDLDENEGGLVADIYEWGDRSGLTLKSTHGPEVTTLISRGNEGDGVIRICGPDVEHPATNVTIDGFTVINTGVHNKGMGICIGGRFAGDMERPANNNIVRNCIIDGCTFGIHLMHTDNNLIENNTIIDTREGTPYDFEGVGIQIWGGYGTPPGVPSKNNVIRNNTILNSARYGIRIGSKLFLETEEELSDVRVDFSGTVISGNTISGTVKYAGIGFNSVIGPITIHYNNIAGNVFGVREWVRDGVNVVLNSDTVDATHNWWRHASGPSRELHGKWLGKGDKVSDKVNYMPWLHKSKEEIVSKKKPAYGRSVVLDKTGAYGWNTFSAPIFLDEEADTWKKLWELTGLDYSVAYRFDSATRLWYELNTTDDYAINPSEGFFIKMNNAGSLPILYSTELNLMPPSRPLTAGWNLIGLANLEDMNVEDAFASIATVPGLAGYSQVVSPMGNVSPGVVLAGGTIYVGEAYWVYMLGERTLAGFTMTPVDWVP